MQNQKEEIGGVTMKLTHTFFIHCIPPKSTHQASLRILKRKDGTQFIGKFATGKGKQVQGELMMLFAQHRPERMMLGPLRLDVCWVYPWRKSETKKNKAKGEMYCDTRPDCENLQKMVGDIMERLGFYHDDSQIAHLTFIKMWADEPGINVRLRELT